MRLFLLGIAYLLMGLWNVAGATFVLVTVILPAPGDPWELRRLPVYFFLFVSVSLGSAAVVGGGGTVAGRAWGRRILVALTRSAAVLCAVIGVVLLVYSLVTGSAAGLVAAVVPGTLSALGFRALLQALDRA